MKQLIKKINWKKVGITLLIIYAVVWSYFYLAIQYANHMQNAINTIGTACESSQSCVDAVSRYMINDFSIFKPILRK